MASQTRPRESQNRYLGVGLCGGPGKVIIYHHVFLSNRVGELHRALTSLVGTFGLKEKVSVQVEDLSCLRSLKGSRREVGGRAGRKRNPEGKI